MSKDKEPDDIQIITILPEDMQEDEAFKIIKLNEYEYELIIVKKKEIKCSVCLIVGHKKNSKVCQFYNKNENHENEEGSDEEIYENLLEDIIIEENETIIENNNEYKNKYFNNNEKNNNLNSISENKITRSKYNELFNNEKDNFLDKKEKMNNNNDKIKYNDNFEEIDNNIEEISNNNIVIIKEIKKK
jgi:hypothetical protein